LKRRRGWEAREVNVSIRMKARGAIEPVGRRILSICGGVGEEKDCDEEER
jgi:hypothetical protein